MYFWASGSIHLIDGERGIVCVAQMSLLLTLCLLYQLRFDTEGLEN